MKKYMEIRTRKGRLDDLVFSDVDVHLEEMSSGVWWLGIYKGEKRLAFFMRSSRKITMEIVEQDIPVKFVEQEK